MVHPFGASRTRWCRIAASSSCPVSPLHPGYPEHHAPESPFASCDIILDLDIDFREEREESERVREAGRARDRDRDRDSERESESEWERVQIRET